MALRLSGDGSLNLSDVTLDNVTASGLSASGTVSLPPTTSIGNVSDTEIAFVDGVTSALQTQLNAKADKAAGYQYVTTLYITANNTFEKAFALKLANPSSNEATPWLRAIRVTVQGAGGAGGGANTTGSGALSEGGGGGSGTYSEKFITDIAGLSASVTVTVGSGGVGVSAGTGGTGGQSAFGSTTAPGGEGGGASSAGAANLSTGGAGGAAGASSDLTITGERGGPSYWSFSAAAFGTLTNIGARSQFGGPAAYGVSTGSDGSNASNKGAGGNGANNRQNQATARTGGNGAAGIVIVELFA